MAIDFKRFLEQAGSGYIQAKIRNTEANDQLYANLAENFGNTYYQEILPNTIAAENVREKNYGILESNYGTPLAELADIGNYTVDKSSMASLQKLIDNNQIDFDAIEKANLDSNYNMRYNQRIKSDAEKYQTVFEKFGMKQQGGLGPATMDLLVKPEQKIERVVAPAPTEFDSQLLKDYMTAKPEDTKVETKLAQIPKTIMDYNSAYGSYQPNANVEGGYIYNLAGDYNDQYRSHNEIADKIKPGKDQIQIALQSTKVMQNEIMPAIQSVQFGDTSEYIVQSGTSVYFNSNKAIQEKNAANAPVYELKDIDLNQNQLSFITNAIKSVNENEVKNYGSAFQDIYNKFKSINKIQDAVNEYNSNPNTFKDAFSYSVIIKADSLDKKYGSFTADLFLNSIQNVKSVQGADIASSASYALNQLRARRLNNRG